MIQVVVAKDDPPSFCIRRKRFVLNSFKNKAIDPKDQFRFVFTVTNVKFKEHPKKSFKSLDKAKALLKKARRAATKTDTILACNEGLMMIPTVLNEETRKLKVILLQTKASALFSLNETFATFKVCQDILEHLDSPSFARFKVIERMAFCKAKTRARDAQQWVDLAIQTLKASPSNNKTLIKTSLQSLLDGIKAMKESQASPGFIIPQQCPPPHVHPDIVIEKDDLVGRHAVTKSKIKLGDIILSEEPVVSVLFRSCYNQRCIQCFGPLIRIVPCHSCSEVGFCSESCLTSARFHQIECGFANVLSPSNPSFLALRLVSQDTIKDDAAMEAILDLQAAKDEDLLLDLTIQACIVIRTLEQMNYFHDKSEENLIEIGVMVTRFLAIITENSHELVQVDRLSTGFDGSFSSIDFDEAVVAIGASLNLKSTLFNNSCDVNTHKYHVGNKTVMVANRDIDQAEEVCDFYGQHYFQAPRDQRWIKLGFECQCIACHEDWPVFAKLKGDTEPLVQAKMALQLALASMDLDLIKDRALSLCQKLQASGRPCKSLISPELIINFCNGINRGNVGLSFIEGLS